MAREGAGLFGTPHIPTLPDHSGTDRETQSVGGVRRVLRFRSGSRLTNVAVVY